MTSDVRVPAIMAACDALLAGREAEAADAIMRGYPAAASRTYPKPQGTRLPPGAECKPSKRKTYSGLTSARQQLRLFERDHFTDRYSGQHLIAPPILAILSHVLPAVVPVTAGWNEKTTHPAYWQLMPVLDHRTPPGRGGDDSDGNLRTTSYERNEAKGQCTFEETGWREYREEELPPWDGYLGWFRRYVEQHPTVVNIKVPGMIGVDAWYAAVLIHALLKDHAR